MNIAQTIPLADSWGMHDGDIGVGWLIVMVPMMALFMGGMMWMMMRAMGGSSSARSSVASETSGATESPIDILERRFAAGEISMEEYCARREALVDGVAEPTTKHQDEPSTAARAENGGP